MPAAGQADANGKSPRRKPAATPAAREKQLVSLAYDLAEKQLREGTASSQVISTFLKYGSAREKLEQARIEQENHFLAIKAATMEANQGLEALFEDAIKAFKGYAGHDDAETLTDFDDGYGDY